MYKQGTFLTGSNNNTVSGDIYLIISRLAYSVPSPQQET